MWLPEAGGNREWGVAFFNIARACVIDYVSSFLVEGRKQDFHPRMPHALALVMPR